MCDSVTFRSRIFVLVLVLQKTHLFYVVMLVCGILSKTLILLGLDIQKSYIVHTRTMCTRNFAHVHVCTRGSTCCISRGTSTTQFVDHHRRIVVFSPLTDRYADDVTQVPSLFWELIIYSAVNVSEIFLFCFRRFARLISKRWRQLLVTSCCCLLPVSGFTRYWTRSSRSTCKWGFHSRSSACWPRDALRD